MLDAAPIRNDWTRAEAEEIYNKPFMDLLFEAQSVHRQHYDPNQVQKSKLLSIKTGGCAEDCAYCSQSARNGAKLSANYWKKYGPKPGCTINVSNEPVPLEEALKA